MFPISTLSEPSTINLIKYHIHFLVSAVHRVTMLQLEFSSAQLAGGGHSSVSYVNSRSNAPGRREVTRVAYRLSRALVRIE